MANTRRPGCHEFERNVSVYRLFYILFYNYNTLHSNILFGCFCTFLAHSKVCANYLCTILHTWIPLLFVHTIFVHTLCTNVCAHLICAQFLLLFGRWICAQTENGRIVCTTSCTLSDLSFFRPKRRKSIILTNIMRAFRHFKLREPFRKLMNPNGTNIRASEWNGKATPEDLLHPKHQNEW